MAKKLVLILFVLLMFSVEAQKIKIASGEVKDLKGVDNYHVVFDYEDLEIANYESEEAFLADKMALREEKEEGLGEKFKASWFADRKNRYEPKFISAFNDYFIMKVKIEVGENPNAKYTIKVKSKFLYPGYNVGVWHENSKLKAIITIFETENPENIVLKTKEVYVRGQAAYNGGERNANAYGLLGLKLAAYLRKKTF